MANTYDAAVVQPLPPSQWNGLPVSLMERHRQAWLLERGWRTGSSLENSAMRLFELACIRPSEVEREFRIGRYRLDFAWTDVKIAIEVDGWQHRRPSNAARDAARDAFLRSRGWLILRVDDEADEVGFHEQLIRAIQVVYAIKNKGWLR